MLVVQSRSSITEEEVLGVDRGIGARMQDSGLGAVVRRSIQVLVRTVLFDWEPASGGAQPQAEPCFRARTSPVTGLPLSTREQSKLASAHRKTLAGS